MTTQGVGFVLQGTVNAAVSHREEVKNNAMALALARSGYKLRQKKVSWPRAKAVKAIRVDCSTGYAVGFIQ